MGLSSPWEMHPEPVPVDDMIRWLDEHIHGKWLYGGTPGKGGFWFEIDYDRHGKIPTDKYPTLQAALEAAVIYVSEK